MTKEQIKDKVFEECLKMYEAAHLEAEGIAGFNNKEIIEAKVAFQECYRNIMFLIGDYHDKELQ